MDWDHSRPCSGALPLKAGPGAAALPSPGNSAETQNLGPSPTLPSTNQNLRFNKISGEFVCILKSEEGWYMLQVKGIEPHRMAPSPYIILNPRPLFISLNLHLKVDFSFYGTESYFERASKGMKSLLVRNVSDLKILSQRSSSMANI